MLCLCERRERERGEREREREEEEDGKRQSRDQFEKSGGEREIRVESIGESIYK